MKPKKTKGINTVRAKLSDGSVKIYRYDRKSGKAIAGFPGTKEFDANLKAARDGKAPLKPKTMGDLITIFKGSAAFTTKSDATKGDYGRYLDEIRDEFGTMPLAALQEDGVREDFNSWRDRFSETPRAADYRWSVLQRVLSVARKRGHIGINHAEGGDDLYQSDRSDIIWEAEHVAAFMAVAHPALQRVMALALFTGQRQGDLRRLTWTSVKPDGLRFEQRRKGKLKRTVYVPYHKDLRPILEATPRVGVNVLTSARGRAWTRFNLKNKWDDAFKSANLWLTGLHFHDLRGTAVTLLSEAGCTTHEIASITGHSLKTVETILDRYSARTPVLALAAMRKLENNGSTTLQNASTILQNVSSKRSGGLA